jgi:hypothetical protein
MLVGGTPGNEKTALARQSTPGLRFMCILVPWVAVPLRRPALLDGQNQLRSHLSEAYRSLRHLSQLVRENPGVPELPPRSKSFNLGDDYRDVGQLDFSASLGCLTRHELMDASENCFFHGQDLGVDVSPENRLFQRSGCRISLVVHA